MSRQWRKQTDENESPYMQSTAKPRVLTGAMLYKKKDKRKEKKRWKKT